MLPAFQVRQVGVVGQFVDDGDCKCIEYVSWQASLREWYKLGDCEEKIYRDIGLVKNVIVSTTSFKKVAKWGGDETVLVERKWNLSNGA